MIGRMEKIKPKCSKILTGFSLKLINHFNFNLFLQQTKWVDAGHREEDTVSIRLLQPFSPQCPGDLWTVWIGIEIAVSRT